ncbi:MAG TPA: vitamin K epoxide reductase family protein [Chloroflexota bacterium]|nr:vitamin K epoxide reductase family protein [Chloroflexota bacterium]
MSLSRWSATCGALGFGISLYLAIVHYAQGQVSLACATTGVINCEQVTSSAESMIGPVPVAVLGIAWFGLCLVLLAVRPRPLWLLIWTGIGVGFVFYLIYAELFLIGAVCLWCTAVHLLVLALFLLAVAEAAAAADDPLLSEPAAR